MTPKQLLHAVKDRLRLVEVLVSLREHAFDLQPAAKPGAGEELDHPRRQIDGACVYLLLTCFDMLGQPTDFVDFGAWLKAAKFDAVRKKVAASLPDSADATICAQALYDEYLKTFAVKASFYRFFDLLDAAQQRKLFESVLVSRSDPQAGKLIEPHAIDFAKSKKALFELRNGFTHTGKVPASVYSSFVKHFGSMKCVEIAGSLRCGYVPVLRAVTTSVCKEISVFDWPETLLQSAQEALEKASSANAG